VDDTSYAIQYDSWYGAEDPLASGGGYRAAEAAGQWMALQTGPTDTISLITYRGPDQGRALLLIDGVMQGWLEGYAPTSLYQVSREFSGLPLGPHVIMIYVLGAGHPASSGTEVRVDAFDLGGLATIVEDDDLAVIYKSWLGLTTPWAFGGGLRATLTAAATVTFDFTGTQFTWITLRGPAAGLAEVYVDGTFVETVELYNPAWQVQYGQVIGGLGPGAHTVEIRALTRGAGRGGNLVVFDGFSVP